MELAAHGSSRFCSGLCALEPTPSGPLYDPNMSEARTEAKVALRTNLGTSMRAQAG